MSTHDLNKYKISKELTEDYSKLLPMIRGLKNVLVPYQRYKAIYGLLLEIEACKAIMGSQLGYYSHVNKNKGLVDEQRAT